MTFYWLNFHVNYACRDSGMCCTSGWPIPVERARVAAIDEAIASNVIPLRATPWLAPERGAPDDVAGVIALQPNGHCVFFEAGRPGCAIHAVKPAACLHFPYVCLIDQRGVRVNLSHYCPTAASMLFEHAGAIDVVEGPSPVAEGVALEGLDARDALPPLAPGTGAGGSRLAAPGSRLMSLDEFSAWERHQILNARIDALQADDLALFDHARASVPPPWTWPAAPPDVEGAWWSLVAPQWTHFAGVLQRFAAAKIFASWAAYQGDGLEAVTRAARIAAAVLRVEAVRRCLELGQPIDRELLKEAIRQTDLLLVHYADPERLIAAPGIR